MNLKEFLSLKKLSVADLAKLSGCGRPMISMILSGKRLPRPKLALRIEKATNGSVTRDELLFPELYRLTPEHYQIKEKTNNDLQ